MEKNNLSFLVSRSINDIRDTLKISEQSDFVSSYGDLKDLENKLKETLSDLHQARLSAKTEVRKLKEAAVLAEKAGKKAKKDAKKAEKEAAIASKNKKYLDKAASIREDAKSVHLDGVEEFEKALECRQWGIANHMIKSAYYAENAANRAGKRKEKTEAKLNKKTQKVKTEKKSRKAQNAIILQENTPFITDEELDLALNKEGIAV